MIGKLSGHIELPENIRVNAIEIMPSMNLKEMKAGV
jgi:hypothetical protein